MLDPDTFKYFMDVEVPDELEHNAHRAGFMPAVRASTMTYVQNLNLCGGDVCMAQ